MMGEKLITVLGITGTQGGSVANPGLVAVELLNDFHEQCFLCNSQFNMLGCISNAKSSGINVNTLLPNPLLFFLQ
ncbi:unnamed protein product [Clonostachys rosea f. rosea IK726]|uniref:Uncharacterized protein n=1 Tax=Clonostachys rosea f. rosea IK726 TaxID=1349383 RepID=A0ACA9USW6_BIOOC|nr:unnamed protein product [Clonostachys rosea f. rosea IK726]